MLAWVDVETTGLDPEKDWLLEVGVMVTDHDLAEIASMNYVIARPVQQAVDKMDDFVRDMHRASGLITELHNPQIYYLADAARPLETFIKTHFPNERPPMCGSSVHFDRKFLWSQMPDLEKCFGHRNIDVSTVKELVDRWYPMAAQRRPPGQKRHRALDDIRDSIAELAFYRKEIFR